MKNFNKYSAEKSIATVSAGILIMLGYFSITGCSENQGPIATSAIRQSDLEGIDIAYITPGQAINIPALAIDAPESQMLIDKTPEVVDHQEAHAPIDEFATVVTDVPARYTTKVTIYGGFPLYNDTACNIYNLEPDTTKVGAFALGGQDDSVFVAWPTIDGEPSAQIEVCQHQTVEPEGGVILFAE